MPIEIHQVDISGASAYPVCLVAHRSPVGAHVAIWYQPGTSDIRRLIHQAWHYHTRDDAPSEFLESAEEPVVMVVPTFTEEEMRALRSACRLVANYIADHALPYAFNPRDAAGHSDGSIALGTSLGLTCATFLMKVFESAKVPLLHGASWEGIVDTKRLTADKEAQEKLVAYLRTTAEGESESRARDLRKHANAVEKEVGSPRIRAEEVAASSGIGSRPADYATTEPQGRAVLAALMLQNGQQPKTISSPKLGDLLPPSNSMSIEQDSTNLPSNGVGEEPDMDDFSVAGDSGTDL